MVSIWLDSYHQPDDNYNLIGLNVIMYKMKPLLLLLMMMILMIIFDEDDDDDERAVARFVQ